MKTTNKQRKAMPRIAFIAISTIIALFALTGCPDPDPEHTHEWGAWTVTTPATCTAEGVETRTCTLDQAHVETRAIAIDPDAHDYQWRTTTAPTCTDEGEETEVCSHNSSHTNGTRTASALGHDYQWRTITAPTCTEEGEETGTCTHDNSHTTTRPIAIDPNAHDWDEWEPTTATSFIEEYEENRTCSRDSSHKETRNAAPLPITTTQEWNDAKNQLNGKTGSYTLTINDEFGVAGSTGNTFGTTANGSTLTVTLKGSGRMYLTSQGNMINFNSNQTLIIDSADMTLQGLKIGQNNATQDNNAALVRLPNDTNAKLELRNGTICGNGLNPGVFVGGTFVMSGGTISGNTNRGVNVGSGGAFTMSGGTISGNTTTNDGGGVSVGSPASFTMTGGTISGNTAARDGGGVYVGDSTTTSFRFNAGTIYGSNESDESLRNTATRNGAALFSAGTRAQRGTFSDTGAWTNRGNLSTTNDTIKVVNGMIVP